VCALAGCSHHTFHALFRGLEDCFEAVLDDGAQQVRSLIAAAFAREHGWIDGVRCALATLLSYFDANQQMSRVLVIEATAAGPRARTARERHLKTITRMIESHWATELQSQPHELVNQGVMASLLGVLHTHLVESRSDPLITLLGPMMGLAATPFLPPAAVAREVANCEPLVRELLAHGHPTHDPPIKVSLPGVLADPRAHRIRACLLYVGRHPGASNRQIASAVGIANRTQVSAILARLSRLGLLTKHSAGPGHPNAWIPSSHGVQALASIHHIKACNSNR
jgi:AcrR family transcriptional regulator